MIETISPAEAEALMTAAFRASGAGEAQAVPTARALAAAESAGQKGHGLVRTEVYCESVAVGKINGNAAPEATRILPGALRIDAQFGFAYPAMELAVATLPEMARATGIAIAGISRSTHFGVAGQHAEALAEAGCMAIVTGNAAACMAPWGSNKPLYGTNPIAFAAPNPDGPPVVVDLATAAVTKGRLLNLKAQGETKAPEGWAMDREGRPTTDIDEAIMGLLAPMAGPKGAALAMMVELMSACLVGGDLGTEASSLLDAKGPPPNIAQTVIAIAPDAVSAGAYAGRMQDFLAEFAGAEGARLPGAKRFAAREAAAAEGLKMPAALLARIREIAAAGG